MLEVAMMMLSWLVLAGIFLYLVLEPERQKDEYIWFLGIIGVTMVLVGGYNLLIRGGLTGGVLGMWSVCSAGGGMWAGIASVLGIVLLLMTTVAWRKSRKENNPSDSHFDEGTTN